MIGDCSAETARSLDQLKSFVSQKRRPKKYLLSKMSEEGLDVESSKLKSKQKPEYFTNMLKEQRKKQFVSTFIRKLKQSIVRVEPVKHEMFSSEREQMSTLLNGIYIPRNVQVAIKCLLFVQFLLLTIIESTTIMFPLLASTSLFTAMVMVSLCCHLLEIAKKFLTVNERDDMDKSTQLKLIAKDYLLSGFSVDVIIALAFFLQLLCDWDYVGNPTALLLMLKIHSLLQKVQFFELQLISNMYREQIWSLIKVFLFNFIFAHCITMAFVLMARIEPNDNWMQFKDLNNAPWTEQYIWGYYWATTTMLTVGFGDISPKNTSQALCMIFIETTSCLVLAYNVNCVGNIINKIRSYDLEKRNNMKTFRYIMDKANISDETTKRIGNYIRESSKIKRNYNLVEEKEFLESLPNSFRADLLKDSHRNIWQDIIFFKNLSENMLKSLSVRIEKKLAHPEEIIYNAEEEVSLMILGKGGFGYAYRKGASHRNGRLVSKIDVPANQYRIATLDFLLGAVLNYDIKCTDYTILYRMPLPQFVECLKDNPYDFQYYCMICDKDRHLLNEFETEPCQVCNNKDKHTPFKCPQLHYLPLRRHIIDKYRSGSNQFMINMRKHNSRRMGPRFRTLLQMRSLDTNNQIRLLSYEDRDSDVELVQESNLSTLQTYHRLNTIQNSEKNIRVYQQAADRFKEQVTQLLSNNRVGLEWDVASDEAYNFKYYFNKLNAEEFKGKPVRSIPKTAY